MWIVMGLTGSEGKQLDDPLTFPFNEIMKYIINYSTWAPSGLNTATKRASWWFYIKMDKSFEDC